MSPTIAGWSPEFRLDNFNRRCIQVYRVCVLEILTPTLSPALLDSGSTNSLYRLLAGTLDLPNQFHILMIAQVGRKQTPPPPGPQQKTKRATLKPQIVATHIRGRLAKTTQTLYTIPAKHRKQGAVVLNPPASRKRSSPIFYNGPAFLVRANALQTSEQRLFRRSRSGL